MSKWLIGDAVENTLRAEQERVRQATTSEIMRKHAESVLGTDKPKVTTNAKTGDYNWWQISKELHRGYLKEQQDSF